MREVTALAIANGVRSRADTLCWVIFVIWNKAILATKVAWFFNVTDRFAVLWVMTLLVTRLT